jgi:hypothetical protein
MREIKFRAWNPEHDEMIFSSRETAFEKREFYPFCFSVGFSHYPLDGWEIMQFTGIKDCNGKEVYEGDIVKYNELPCCIEWDDGAFELIRNDNFIMHLWNIVPIRLEIIGNIYESPELLK